MMRNFQMDSEPPRQPSSAEKEPPHDLPAGAAAGGDNDNDHGGQHDSDTDTSLPGGGRAAASASSKQTTATTTTTTKNESRHTGKRERKKANEKSGSDELEPQGNNHSKKKKKKGKKGVDPEQEFETVWICSECKEAECLMNPEASVLLICEGPCRRLFHYPCVGLSAVPPQELPYVCPDCTAGRHRCAYCQDYGADGEDVWPCSRKSCGLFYHEACLAMQNVDVVQQTIVPGEKKDSSSAGSDEDDDKAGEEGTEAAAATTTGLSFVCPAHHCWTCTQTSLKEQEKRNASSGGGSGTTTGKQRRRKPKSKPSCSFDCKTERFLYRCIECPRSFHAGCIPPMARFHELALLCHEHAERCKLPDLDIENSIQSSIEKKVEEKLAAKKSRGRNKRSQSGEQNLFLPGMVGDKLTQREEKYYEMLEKLSAGDDDDDRQDEGWFCLPCNIKDEVYSKPPSYRHVHSNRYDPTNKPAKIISSGEVCQCVDFCGDDCLNRMLYTECYGDASKEKKKGGAGGNCRVGPQCGNRLLGQRKFKKCQPAREHGKGWGLKCVEKVLKGELVQEYVGTIIDSKEKEVRLKEWTEEHPNDPNFYVMELLPGWYIDARHEANLSRFINHSCMPNCDLHRINVGGYQRNGIFANRDIAAGEFLSYDYQFDTKLDRFVCRCGSKNCRGNMRGGPAASNGASFKKSKAEIWEEAKAKYERDKKFIAEHYELEEDRRSQVSATVPNAENPTETVANGAQTRYRTEAIQNRIFLWRNAVKGSDFVNRVSRLETKMK